MALAWGAIVPSSHLKRFNILGGRTFGSALLDGPLGA